MQHQKALSPIPISQDWACGPSACTYVLVFYDVIGLRLIFILNFIFLN